MKISRIVALLMVAIAISFTSCEDGEDGRDGTDGINGIDGAPGIDGQDGEDGQNGENGQDGTDGENGEDGEDGAEVITKNIDIEEDDWVADFYLGRNASLAAITDTDLSQTIIDFGVVLVYLNLDGEQYPLPLTIPSDGPSGDQVVTFTIAPDTLNLYNYFVEGGSGTFSASFKYVIIPATVPGRSSSITGSERLQMAIDEGLDVRDYDAVKVWFDLD